ncbi:TOMM precursor leader peptide-binding protein [Amycolatopsis lurida]
MDEPVTVLGHGAIADAIAAVLPCRSGSAIVVAASDTWVREEWPQDTTWLPVRAELDSVVMGPVVVPGEPGCPDCASTRRGLARPEHAELRERYADELARQPAPWLTESAVDFVASLVVLEIAALRRDRTSARTRSALVRVRLADLDVSTHRFLPDPFCRSCGALPPDTRAAAWIKPRSRPKPDAAVYRVGSLESAGLEQLYVDDECGVVRDLRTGTGGGVVVAAAAMGLRDGRTEIGFGRTRGYGASRLTAVLEALERYGGGLPGGKATITYASFAEVADSAVDPRKLGQHAPWRYREPGFRFREFTPEARTRWVWGYSFGRGEPVLVPEDYAYYRTTHHGAEAPFAYEISNGCALGSCLEEAIFHGILEVAERDAFLMTWYARLPAAPIELPAFRDRLVPMLAEAITAETGYRVTAYDTTLEQGIPCSWVVATDLRPDTGRPFLVCAAGSHVDPEKSVENALSELGPILHDNLLRYPAERDRSRAMAADSSLVTEMTDHSLLYGNPDVAPRLDFLTASGTRSRPPAEKRGFAGDDLRDDLLELVGRYLGTGLDVVVVDQTADEHRAGGLACVKVIIPGTLPMTFGHAFRRVDGLPRLRDRLAGREINPHPHPFP